MTKLPGSLSEKIPSREKITASSVTELRIFLFAISLVTICMEVFLLIRGDILELPRGPFILVFSLFYLLFCALEYTFRLFTRGLTATLLPLFPAALLLFLLQKTDSLPFAAPALLTAAAVRILLDFIPHREQVLLFGTFAMDAVAVFLSLNLHVLTGGHTTDKILFVSLVIMTLSSLQELLYGRNKGAFPFQYFALLGVLLLNMPMGERPIDWSPVIEAGEQLARGVMNIADDAAYYLSSVFGDDSYTAGYSSLDVTGGQLEGSQAAQVILLTGEKPYFTYTDPETSREMRVRRTLYLAGGRGADLQQLVHFLSFLHANGVDREHAALFSKISQITVEYAYLDTADEIAPASSILLYSEGRRITSGTGSSRHHKGYALTAVYLDIDYGSPFLAGLYEGSANAPTTNDPRGRVTGANDLRGRVTTLTYEAACSYMSELYGRDLGKILTRREYEEILHRDTLDLIYTDSSYTDTTGAVGRMAELAAALTEKADSDYDKCRIIERYLRQYTYSTKTGGDNEPRSDMSTPQGMAEIADRFLFETQAGYCVHYTSSMVMLLRLAGIPARAVSGYRYVFPFEEEDSYFVSGNCAHIWPEAYLGDAGWVPFEPTAAYRTASDYTWHREDGKTGTDPQDPGPELPELPDSAASDNSADNPQLQGQSAGSLASRIFRITWPVILSIVLLLIALIVGTRTFDRIRYRHASPEIRLKIDVEMIKKKIRQMAGDDFEDRGLLSDYLQRAPREMRPDIQKVFDIYYRAVYGDNSDVSAEESEFARTVREEITHPRGE